MTIGHFLSEHSNVVLAGMGMVGILATAYAGVARARVSQLAIEQKDRELEVAKKELTFQSHALSFGAFLADWQGTSSAMKQLLDDTEIDSIMIFRAWNGKLTPQWTTAVFQMREVGQEPVQYVHFELDDDYVDRVRKIVLSGIITFSVANQPDSFIKDVYNAEGVKSSCWAHINSQSVPDSDAVSISYASFSSCTASELAPETVTKCRMLAGRLKGLAHNFDEQD